MRLCELAALTGLLLPAAASMAQQAAPATAGGDPQAQEFYLSVVLNGQAGDRILRFVRGPGGFAATPAVLQSLGLRIPDGQSAQTVPLSSFEGVQITYDPGQQLLQLTVPVRWLDQATLRLSSGLLQPAKVDPQARQAGLLLNYDVFAQQGGAGTAVNGWSEARAFGMGAGVWSSSMLGRWDDRGQVSSVRLDTAWQLDLPDQMLSITAGDTLTGAPPWGRSLRIGGLRLARNFGLQPYRITAPLLPFMGEATLPSTLELYINGLRQSTQQVLPGQFQLDSVPSFSGAGAAQLVLTDATGQRRAISFDFYAAPQLLQAGLVDGSVELGFVRKDYGRSSWSYDRRPVLVASARAGLSDDSTLETHGELTQGLRLAGAGLVQRLPAQAGIMSASLAASQSQGSTGRQAGAGYQWNGQAFNLALNALRRSRGWRDGGSRFDALGAGVLALDSANVGFASPLGQWSVGLARQRLSDDASSRFLNASWNIGLPGRSTLAVYAVKALAREGSWNVQVAWSLPLDNHRAIAASAQRQAGQTGIAVDVQQNPGDDAGGWGWRLQTSNGAGAPVQGQVTVHGDAGQWTAGASSGGAGGKTSLYASANGALVWLGGGLHATRSVNDAFAVVSTGGVPNVPVRLENRPIGRTSADGLLFVPQLNAYQRNQLEIDTLGLPADYRVDRVRSEAVPERRSGVAVQFALRRVRSIQLTLRDEAGALLPAGSAVSIEGRQPTVVGHEGLVYLEDPVAGLVLHSQAPRGRCRAVLPAGPPASTLTCHAAP